MKLLDNYPTIVCVDELASTNTYLKEWSVNAQLDEGTLVHAYCQTQGKGQQGNIWESEGFKNITSSIIFYPHHIEPRFQFQLSVAAALGVYDFLSQYIFEGLSIKWPNDIYVHDRKIAGVLIDNNIMQKTLQSSIWGTGININQTQFSPNIPNATSLKIETGKEYLVEELLPQLQQAMKNRYIHLGSAQRAEYLHLMYRGEGYHEYDSFGEVFIATFLGVNTMGHLILRTNQGDIREFAIKELQYVLPDTQ